MDLSQIAHHKKRAFLRAFAKNGNVSQSADIVRISRRTHYDWLESDPVYAAAYDEAREQSVDELERIARERAAAGSDTLLIFLLKGERPDKYAERHRVELIRKQEIRERAEKLAAELDLPVEEVERDLVLGVEAARP